MTNVRRLGVFVCLPPPFWVRYAVERVTLRDMFSQYRQVAFYVRDTFLKHVAAKTVFGEGLGIDSLILYSV